MRAARSGPDHVSPCFLSLYPCCVGEGNPSGSVSVLQIGNTHLRSLALKPLSASPIPWSPSADEPSDFIGLSSWQRDSLQHYALCLRPFSPLLHTLAGHSYGVDLGRFPRCLSTLLRRPLERSYSVQSGQAGGGSLAGF